MRLLILAILILCQGLPSLDARQLVPTRIEENRPLQELLALFGIPLDRAVPETQRLWLQKGKERWEFEMRFEEMRPQVWPLFEELGLLDEIEPSRSEYDYALVLGALLTRVKDRVDRLIELMSRGVIINQIVFLTGDRPLLDWEKEATGQSNEAEMVRWVYERSALPKEIPVVLIDSQQRESGGIWRRPQTADTVLDWMKTEPVEGSCLALSNQPYVRYQNAVLRSLLPKEFSVETVGSEAKGNCSVALLLDTLAKELFWLQAQ